MHWKNFLYFSSAEKIAVLILVVIIVFTFGLNVLLSRSNNTVISIPKNDSLIASFQSLNDGLEDKKNETNNYDYQSKNKTERLTNNEQTRKLTGDVQTKHYTDYPKYAKQEKFTEARSISLNETDTTEWKKVPGIGSSFSARIVKYGDKLGGYISVNQLKEVYGVTDEVFDTIVSFIYENEISTDHCAKLNINKLEFKEILAHPYINFEQTKAIMNLRKRTGNITSTNQLAMLEEFTAGDIERISPYIDF